MPTNLASYILRPPTSGQKANLPKYMMPEDAAYYLRNFVRREGKVQSRLGYTKLGTSVSEYPTGLVSYVHSSGVQKIVLATNGGWFKFDSSTFDWVDITEGGNPLTCSELSHQVFRVFYKSGVAYLVGCNGPSDAPIKWDGTSANYSDVGGSPGNAKCMAVLANRMLLGNFTDAPVQIKVSGFNDFETGWSDTQIVNLYDTSGEIVSINEFGNLVAVVYKTDAIYHATAIEAIYPFAFPLKLAGISGPLTPRCIVPISNRHYILARDCNIYTYDGSSYSPIGDHARVHISSTINLDRSERAWGFYNHLSNEIWYLYSSKDSVEPNIGVAVSLLDNSIWPLSFASLKPSAGAAYLGISYISIGDMVQPLSYYTNPLKSYSTTQRQIVLCGEDGQCYREEGTTDDGNTIPVALQTGMISPSEKRNFTTVSETEHYMKGTSGAQSVSVSLRYSHADTGDEISETARTFNLGQPGPYYTGHRRDSRFFGIKFEADASEQIVWEGAKVSGTERGPR